MSVSFDVPGQASVIPNFNSRYLLDVLERESFRDKEAWLFLRELRTGTGFNEGSTQSIDAFALGIWPSKGYARRAFEVKISRSDFKREITNPAKRKLALLYSNQYYFVTPAGLLSIEEIPAECGLIEIAAVPDRYGKLHKVTHPAPWRDTPAPSWRFLAAFVRHAQAEARAQVRSQLEARP